MRTLLIAMAVLSIIGCNYQAGEKSGKVSFITAKAPVAFEFPPGWHKKPENHPFDLQCFSKSNELSTGVFVYQKADLASAFTSQQLLQDHVNDLGSKRANFNLLEQQVTTEHDGKTLTSVVYSGEKSPGKYYYRFTVIEFHENPDIIAVVLQVAIPSSWTKDKPILSEITESARIRSEMPAEKG